jgi:hypothetical protein
MFRIDIKQHLFVLVDLPTDYPTELSAKEKAAGQ